MSRWNTVAIVGVGLIGGSIGLALRQSGHCPRIVGIGRRADRLQHAKRRGAVTETTTSIDKGVVDADLVVVCTPVECIVGHVAEVAEFCRSDTLITDAGSTKAALVRNVEGLQLPHGRFVGSHPLAGSDKSGVAFADSGLFRNRTVVVTPSRRTSAQDVQATREFWTSLEARVVTMSPHAHDVAVAATSHVPHVLASVLSAATPTKHLPLVAGGWLDTTRIAGADVQLWSQILLENKDNVANGIRGIRDRLERFERALAEGDKRDLVRQLAAGKQRRDAVGS